MNKIKEYKGIIIIILIILGFAFYWFQIKPTQTRKECIKNYPNAFNNSTNSFGRLGDSDKAGYERCLREHGLNN